VARPAAAVLVAALLVAGPAAHAGEGAVGRGAYVFHAAGGCSCHTDLKGGGAPLAGGRALATPFGTFYSPNITPDRETGIGGWRLADLARALRQGRAPDGSPYYPAFPYPSFTAMSDADVADLAAYLRTVAPVHRVNRPHDLAIPVRWRWTVKLWKWFEFTPGRFRRDPTRSAAWNRGAYLATALAHCGECHTPRDRLGAVDREMWFAGTEKGPDGEPAPNITPDADTGIGEWSVGDIATLLGTGVKPNFDDVQGAMAEAIEQGYRYLSDADRRAIGVYVLSLAPIHHRVGKPRPPAGPYE